MIIIFLCRQSASSQVLQVKENTKDSLTKIYPKYKGGTSAIYKIIKDNLVYPQSAIDNRIGGEVIIQFEVDTSGNVDNIITLKGINEDIDKEAIRLIGLLNGWSPGKINGEKCSVVFNLPIYFYPDRKFKRKYLKEHK